MKSYHAKTDPSSKDHLLKRWIVTIAVVLPLIIAAAVGLLYLELARFELMQRQLRNITESAALAGTAALANGLGKHSVEEAQLLAMQAAVWTVKQNSILDNHFNDTNVGADLNDGGIATPDKPGNIHLNITLVDGDGNVLPTGNENATAVRVQAMYAESPLLAFHIIPLAPVLRANATAIGGPPMLDVILCFDLSGSMDDQTPVYLINRHWNGAIILYDIVAQGTIYDVLRPDCTGTSFNSVWPQNLSLGALSGNKANEHPYVFCQSPVPNPNLIAGLRANISFSPKAGLIAEQGCPPGNFVRQHPAQTSINGNKPTAYANGFTDCIVNVGNQGEYRFPNVATCLEASRGNLESQSLFKTSKAFTSRELSGVAPKAGYYQAYWTAARDQIQPMRAAREAATDFLKTLSASANVHFGLVTFSNTAGTDINSAWTGAGSNNDKIDVHYTQGGIGDFPLPLIALNSRDSNLLKITCAINGRQNGPNLTRLALGPTGGTNFADTLKEAIDQMTDFTKHRWKANPVIVLFTDGVPNAPENEPAPDYGAFAQARAASDASIPVHTIGLAQNPAIQPLESEILGDGRQSGPAARLGCHGIACRSGHGAIYLPVKTTSVLKSAFQYLAKILVSPNY